MATYITYQLVWFATGFHLKKFLCKTYLVTHNMSLSWAWFITIISNMNTIHAYKLLNITLDQSSNMYIGIASFFWEIDTFMKKCLYQVVSKGIGICSQKWYFAKVRLPGLTCAMKWSPIRTLPPNSWHFEASSGRYIKSVKCYSGGLKIHFIPSIH